MIPSPANFLGMNCLSGTQIHRSTDVVKSWSTDHSLSLDNSGTNYLFTNSPMVATTNPICGQPRRLLTHAFKRLINVINVLSYWRYTSSSIYNKKLIRRRDSERELSLRRNCTRTRKCNRHLHKFHHRSFLQRRFTKFSEIMQCNGHYAVQGHSTSPILVPYATCY